MLPSMPVWCKLLSSGEAELFPGGLVSVLLVETFIKYEAPKIVVAVDGKTGGFPLQQSLSLLVSLNSYFLHASPSPGTHKG